jgi:hypothetical protein
MRTKTIEKVFRVEVKGKRSPKGKVTELKVETGFQERPMVRIQEANELLIEVAIGKKPTTEGGIVEVADPCRSVVRETHIGLLMRLSRKVRELMQQGMRTSMKSESIEDPIAIRSVPNEPSKEGMRARETGGPSLQARGKEIGKGGLHFSLNVSRERVKPDTKGTIVTKGMQRRNKTTMVLSVLDDAIPPGREIEKGISGKGRKMLLKLLLSLGVETAIRQVGKEEGFIEVNRGSANGIVENETVIGTRSKPGNNGASRSIHNHVGWVMNVALEVLPGGASTMRRKSRALSKKRTETQRVREASATIGIPGGIRSGIRRERRWSRGRSRGRNRLRRVRGWWKMVRGKRTAFGNGIRLETEVAKSRRRSTSRRRRDDGSSRSRVVRRETHGATKGRRDEGGCQRRSRRSGGSLHGTSDRGLRDGGQHGRGRTLKKGRRRVGMGTKSTAQESTSLTREDDKHTK